MANPQKENGYEKLRNNWKFRRDLEKARLFVFHRDKGVCKKCGKKQERYDVDHITPISKGGDLFNIENLQTLCKQCHREKSRSERCK